MPGTTETPTETPTPTPISTVTLDGQPLDEDSYEENPDGTVTIDEAIRRTLTPGDHTIVITYVNGATRTLTVHVDGADRSIGSTGEASINIIAAIILLASMVCVFFATKLRKDEE